MFTLVNIAYVRFHQNYKHRLLIEADYGRP